MRTAVLILPLLLLCSCGGPDALVRADKPLSLAEVRRRSDTDFPFPASAHNIHYAIYADWQAYEHLVRFDAPPVDCEAAIPRVLAWHRPAMPRSTPYASRAFAGPLPTSSRLHPAPWFDGAVIRRGLFAGEDSSHTPNVWVDLDVGRLYYRSTD